MERARLRNGCLELDREHVGWMQQYCPYSTLETELRRCGITCPLFTHHRTDESYYVLLTCVLSGRHEYYLEREKGDRE